MRKEISLKSLFGKIIFIAFVIGAIFIIRKIYLENYLNDFYTAEVNPGVSSFYRDNNQVYNGKRSYCIDSPEFNDAIFAKTLQVKKNTGYKISCMVKTENVITEKDLSTAGVNICVFDTTEKSKSITGNNDWTELIFYLDSKNREQIDISFRLGSYDDNAKGKAWIADIKVEESEIEKDNTWNMACFIFKNTNVEIEGVKHNITMSEEDITLLKQDFQRFSIACSKLSDAKMFAICNPIVIEEELTTISYDRENGYYVDPVNVSDILDKYVKDQDYDHIFVAIRLGDTKKETEVQDFDWIGLGGMEYNGIGFSNIRLPNDSRSYIYKYDESINTFPEEVYLHEFLHTLERNLKSYGITDFPALHDYSKYGYKSENQIGLMNWYEAYMKKTIKNPNGGENLGLDEIVYSSKPINETNFQTSIEIDLEKEPENIFEIIQILATKVITNLKSLIIKN